MNFDEQLYLLEIAHLKERIINLQNDLAIWENSSLMSDINTHIYMNGDPHYQVDGKIPASTSSYVNDSTDMVLQKNKFSGYGWSFGNTHLSYTVDNRVVLNLVSDTGQILKTTTVNHRPTFGDLSSYFVAVSDEHNFLPIYYDNNTGKYKCIKANTSSYTYTDDSTILHPLFRPL